MVSLLARTALSIGYLPATASDGYDAFIAPVDTIVIGRKSFETVSAYDPWPDGTKPVVDSTRDLRLHARSGSIGRVNRMLDRLRLRRPQGYNGAGEQSS